MNVEHSIHSNLKADYQKETNLPYEDCLTGLFNHGFFQIAIDREVKRSRRHGRPFTAAFIDIDSFSLYNRRHGSARGDRILREVAGLIQVNVRQADLAARYGGDVFAAILVESDRTAARVATDRIRKMVEKSTGGDPTVSVGLATFPTDAMTRESLLQKTQEALREAKIRGKNRVHSFEKSAKESPTETKAVVLVVDDEPLNVKLLEALLLPLNYEVMKAFSGEEALSLMGKEDVDLVLLDIMMPGITGYEVCRIIKQNETTRMTPVIVVTALGGTDRKIEAIEAGADDFLTKPANKAELLARTRSLIKLKKLNRSLTSIENVLFSLAKAVEAKDAYTQGHIERVANLAVSLGKNLELAEKEIEALRFGGILHDIGKIGIPEQILNKGGPLTDQEWQEMMKHCDLGHKICLPLQGTLGLALDVIRHHHEKLDGTGYPDGLEGEEISEVARIMAVVDFYDALVTDRPYRRAMTKEEALSILLQEVEAGKFDAQVVASFVDLMGHRVVA